MNIKKATIVISLGLLVLLAVYPVFAGQDPTDYHSFWSGKGVSHCHGGKTGTWSGEINEAINPFPIHGTWQSNSGPANGTFIGRLYPMPDNWCCGDGAIHNKDGENVGTWQGCFPPVSGKEQQASGIFYWDGFPGQPCGTWNGYEQ